MGMGARGSKRDEMGVGSAEECCVGYGAGFAGCCEMTIKTGGRWGGREEIDDE